MKNLARLLPLRSVSRPSTFHLLRRLVRLIPYSLAPIPLFALLAFGQQTWMRTYGGPSADKGNSVQQTADGGYIFAGTTESLGRAFDVYIVKTDASGDTLWTRTYGGSNVDEGYSVQQTSDGGYIIAGYADSYGPGLDAAFLVKTDSTGGILWYLANGGQFDEQVYSVRQTLDGGFIAAGEIRQNNSGFWDVCLLRTNASGDTLWTRTYGGAKNDFSYSVQQTSDGGYVLAGSTNSFGTDSMDVYLIKTDASGDTVWTRTYGGAESDYGTCVQQTADKGYIVAGYTDSFGAGGPDVYLIKTDASGDTLWTRTYGGSGDDEGRSVQQTTDGGYILAGITNSFGAGYYDCWLIKTDASGDTLWTKTFGGARYDGGYSVQQTSDGGYIITGLTHSFGDPLYGDAWLIKTDANGNVGVEEQVGSRQKAEGSLKAKPNPFTSFATIPGHEKEGFMVYDVTGRKVGKFKGDRIGEGLGAGVYFVKAQVSFAKPFRIVKVR